MPTARLNRTKDHPSWTSRHWMNAGPSAPEKPSQVRDVDCCRGRVGRRRSAHEPGTDVLTTLAHLMGRRWHDYPSSTQYFQEKWDVVCGSGQRRRAPKNMRPKCGQLTQLAPLRMIADLDRTGLDFLHAGSAERAADRTTRRTEATKQSVAVHLDERDSEPISTGLSNGQIGEHDETFRLALVGVGGIAACERTRRSGHRAHQKIMSRRRQRLRSMLVHQRHHSPKLAGIPGRGDVRVGVRISQTEPDGERRIKDLVATTFCWRLAHDLHLNIHGWNVICWSAVWPKRISRQRSPR